MKRALLLVILLSGVATLLYACASMESGGMRAEGIAMPAASGAALWDYLREADYARKWSMWPGKIPFYQGTQPHGSLLVTYVSGEAYQAIVEKKGALPNEAIVIKENYTSGRQLTDLTVMYKVQGYNPEAGDWFWAVYQPDGRIQAEGKVSTCIECHGTQKDNDYIRTAPLK